MTRFRIGAVLWLASALVFLVQFVVALQWPHGYSITANAISDMGITVCGEFSEQGNQVREVCSPWHPLFNIGVSVSGLLMLVGAVLLFGWWQSRSGRVRTLFIAAAGAFVVVVGLAPWDLHPEIHDSSALAQALFQWIGMVLIAVAAGRGAFRMVTLIAVIISVVAFALFVWALDGGALPIIGFGGAERLSFDTLTLWVAVAGALVLRGISKEAGAASSELRAASAPGASMRSSAGH